ncbi:hypothetical protein SCRM01_135c [Synechococcus phage S-CRM01]|uniref:hypothetical protein n=1 Tax=Synechococcus phage S-CRM01 TaxID=1026955 RepID=UPI000209E3D8|nr:hypothetical protein SCRM01_135c [Synechococcus phage S-CRM01]AEC53081.1 hypothetical protein SCRM01_135c [Synechococcus phage S-CRM01]
MIFDYWKYHMVCPVESIICNQNSQDDWPSTNIFGNHDSEGLCWYDGHNASFWYMLNVSWYKMNNKLFANTYNTDPFDPYLRDFDKDYLQENGYL